MSFFDELGLKAAEQLEQSVGAYVALASYKRLLGGPPDIRGRAVFGALRCAIDLGEDREIRELASSWSVEHEAVLSRDPNPSGRPSTPAALVARLLSQGRRDLAAEVAQAEARRRPTAHARYLLARAREQASGPDPELWNATIIEAEKEGNRAILVRAVARWLELVLWSPRASRSQRQEIVARATSVDLTEASAAEKLVVLKARLLAPSRFARASALSGLEELARTGTAAIRTNAILTVARDADSADGRLDPIEADRTRATLRHWEDEREREAAIARLDATTLLAKLAKDSALEPKAIDAALSAATLAAPEIAAQIHRVRSLVSGGIGSGTEARGPVASAIRLAALGLDAVVAANRSQDGDAEAAMARATELLSTMSPIPGALWFGARMALRSKTGTTRRAAAELLHQALLRSSSAPPYGFVELAKDLEQNGFGPVASIALQEGVRQKEPGAAALYADLERQLGYAAFARGDRHRALEALRRAKELLSRT